MKPSTIFPLYLSLLLALTLGLQNCKKTEDPVPSQPAGATITNVRPFSGRGGTLVTISGTNLPQTGFTVTINGKPATVRQATATNIQIDVPANCGSGPIELKTAVQTLRTSGEFVYLFDRFSEMVYYIQDGRVWSMDIFQGRKQAATPTGFNSFNNAEALLLNRPTASGNQLVIFEKNGAAGGFTRLKDAGDLDKFGSLESGHNRTTGWLGIQSVVASKSRPGSIYYLWNKRDIYDNFVNVSSANLADASTLKVRYGNDMVFLAEAGGLLYIFQANGGIIGMTVNANGSLQLAGSDKAQAQNYGGFKAATDLNGNLWFITNNGLLYRFMPSTNTLTNVVSLSGKVVWSNAQAMTAVGNYLMIVDDGQLYRVDPASGNAEVAGTERLSIRTNNVAGFHN